MFNYPFNSLLAIALFASVHLFAHKAQKLSLAWKRRFLSIGSGIAIAYVFIDLLPKLSKYEPIVTSAVRHFFPYFERHVYAMALIGFLLFFSLDRSKDMLAGAKAYWFLSLASYALFNLFIGYAVVDVDNPEVKPLLLFSLAIALHYFVNDYSLTQSLGDQYDHVAKWILVSSLILGWLLGYFYTLPAAAVGLVSAFIGGGVIMNVTRHELPSDKPNSLSAFLIAAALYSLTLLMIG